MFSTNFSGSCWAAAISSPLSGLGLVVGGEHQHGAHGVVGLGGQLHGPIVARAGRVRTVEARVGATIAPRWRPWQTADWRAWSRPRPPSAWSTARPGGCSTAATRSATWPPTAATTGWWRCCWTATGRPRDEVVPATALSPPVLAALRGLPTSCAPLDALRTAVSAFGAERRMGWPPTAEQARELIALGPAAVGAFARLRDGRSPVDAAGTAPPRRRRAAAATRSRASSRTRPRRGRWTRTSRSAPSTA